MDGPKIEEPPPKLLQDDVVETLIQGQRGDFLDSINKDHILELARQYHASQRKGYFFKAPVRGAYNVCYFVMQPGREGSWSANRWVIRIPIDPYLPFGAKSKMESEIATMV